jgi:hypothetical protein
MMCRLCEYCLMCVTVSGAARQYLYLLDSDVLDCLYS